MECSATSCFSDCDLAMTGAYKKKFSTQSFNIFFTLYFTLVVEATILSRATTAHGRTRLYLNVTNVIKEGKIH